MEIIAQVQRAARFIRHHAAAYGVDPHRLLPPVLILHGDADTLTPLEQSEWFVARAREVGATVKLVVRRGKKHGWPGMLWDIRRFADWYDQHLRPGASVPTRFRERRYLTKGGVG
jgi:acetyl esterase/lipase